MAPKKRKKIVISLIKDDLINSKLIYGLNDLGLQAEDYFLNLGSTVFILMKIDGSIKNEPIYEHYFDLLRKVKYIDASRKSVSLDELAEEIYNKLTLLKPLCR